MITAITFRYKHGHKYVPDHRKVAYRDLSISNLFNTLFEDQQIFKQMADLIYELNKDLDRTDITECIQQFFPNVAALVILKTKTKRTYSFMGLTIHEQDQPTPKI